MAEDLGAGLLGDGPRLLDVVEVGGGDLRVVLEDRIEHRQAHERLAEVEDLVAVGHVGGTEYRLSQFAEQFLGQVHVVFVVGVGLVELEHGELGVVPGRDAFVTEVAVDLEDLLETADHQALEVQLRGDAQEHGHVQRVVMGLERLGRGAAGDGLQHRGLHFEETALAEETADVGDDLGTHAEGVAGFLVDHQVDVALAVALLGVGQAMVLVRQRTQRLGQQAHAGHVDVQVALARAGQHAFGADDVAQVPGLDLGQGFFRQGLAVDVDLQALAAVLEDDEGTAVEHDPTGHLDRDRCGFQLFLGLVGVLFLQVREVGVAAEVVGEGDGPGFAHGGKFFLALGDQLVFFLLQFVLVELLVAHGLGGSWLGSLACGNGLRNRGEKRSERRPGKAGNGEDTEFTIVKNEQSEPFSNAAWPGAAALQPLFEAGFEVFV
ncbi:hypothetical protein ALP65_04607 [Pseudomonas aeruginosa]|uniref:Uncharacterized protein n=1 Tax=Pseudomonas aeruginosa TaxID=287 RepID=A0A3M5D2Y6_PSEAI|nr:hypothetical protein ALP65_04607 [Pseudomonas aeruginosa]